METPCIVVGIDFGTTYSGVSYSFKAADDRDDKIHIVEKWRENEDEDKIPSLITYQAGDVHVHDWGFECPKLDVPPFSLGPTERWVTEYLEAMYNYLSGQFDGLLREYDRLPSIEYIFSIPTSGKNDSSLFEIFRKLIAKSGFGTESAGYKTNVISEPRAASYMHGAKEGENFIVCDTGGGTTDMQLLSINDPGTKGGSRHNSNQILRGTQFRKLILHHEAPPPMTEPSPGNERGLEGQPILSCTLHHENGGQHKRESRSLSRSCTLSRVAMWGKRNNYGTDKVYLDTGSCDSWISESFVRKFGLVVPPIASLTTATIITQYGSPSTKIPGALSLLNTYTNLNLHCSQLIDPSAELFISSTAIWVLATMHYRHIHQDDKFQDHAIVAGAGIGIAGNLIWSLAEGKWGLLGVYVFLCVSPAMLMSSLIHSIARGRERAKGNGQMGEDLEKKNIAKIGAY